MTVFNMEQVDAPGTSFLYDSFNNANEFFLDGEFFTFAAAQ